MIQRVLPKKYDHFVMLCVCLHIFTSVSSRLPSFVNATPQSHIDEETAFYVYVFCAAAESCNKLEKTSMHEDK